MCIIHCLDQLQNNCALHTVACKKMNGSCRNSNSRHLKFIISKTKVLISTVYYLMWMRETSKQSTLIWNGKYLSTHIFMELHFHRKDI